MGFQKVTNFYPTNYLFLNPLHPLPPQIPGVERRAIFFWAAPGLVYAVAGRLDFKISEVIKFPPQKKISPPNLSFHQLFPQPVFNQSGQLDFRRMSVGVSRMRAVGDCMAGSGNRSAHSLRQRSRLGGAHIGGDGGFLWALLVTL